MRKNLPAIVVAVLVLLATGYLGLSSVGDNLVYYWSPADLQSAGAKAVGAEVRLGGLVKAGTVKTEGGATVFTVVDATNAATVVVRTETIPPQMFREGIGVVVEGTLGADGVFHSRRLLVKHDEFYEKPKAGDAPETMFKSVKE